jgi:hypothetical protein
LEKVHGPKIWFKQQRIAATVADKVVDIRNIGITNAFRIADRAFDCQLKKVYLEPLIIIVSWLIERPLKVQRRNQRKSGLTIKYFSREAGHHIQTIVQTDKILLLLEDKDYTEQKDQRQHDSAQHGSDGRI